jgi:hypothetical protein
MLPTEHQPGGLPPDVPMPAPPGLDARVNQLFDPTPPATPADDNSPYLDLKAIVQYVQDRKKESLELRWVYERGWWRALLYILGRQWIFYDRKRGQWLDKRLAKWIPRPVTNICRQTLRIIRAVMGAVKLNTIARPLNNDSKCVATAETADRLEPLIAKEHDMARRLPEARFWFIATGNVFLHPWWNPDKKTKFSQFEQCQSCGEAYAPQELAKQGPQPVCPGCGVGRQFKPAVDAMNMPHGEEVPEGGGETDVLSPFEIAVPPDYVRLPDCPYVNRLRWRTKRWCEDHYADAKDQDGKPLLKGINWERMPHERSLQMVRSMASQSDLGTTPVNYSSTDTVGAEGIAEYEHWGKPSADYPHGLVARVLGDSSPRLVVKEDEGLPGMLPYRDQQGHPWIPFVHAGYDDIGGRLWASSAIDSIFQKQDQINQSDSMSQLAEQRMSNPVWLKPKGSEVKSFTGEPGLVVEYNALVAGGNAKPERIAGQNIPASIPKRRASLLQDVKDLTGTHDPLQGQQSGGVDSFAGLNLLVERSQSQFGPALESFGLMYQEWYSMALELERQFGPDERTQSVMKPNRSFTFQTFKHADLMGAIEIIVEDGSQTPKTALGERAAIEHASQLGLVNVNDPEQAFTLRARLGVGFLSPSLDSQVKAALREQDAFEQVVAKLPPPLPGQPRQLPMVMKAVPMPMAPPQNGGGQPTPAPQPTPPPQPTAPPQATPPAQPPIPMMQVPVPVLPGNPLRRREWDDDRVHIVEHTKWANGDEAVSMFAAFPQLEMIFTQHLLEHKQAEQLAAMQQAMIGAAATPRPPQGAALTIRNSNQNAGGTRPANNPGKGNVRGA